MYTAILFLGWCVVQSVGGTDLVVASDFSKANVAVFANVHNYIYHPNSAGVEDNKA